MLQGEPADAHIEDAEAFKAKLPELLAMYDPKYIYNVYEVGLFYEQTWRRTFMEQGEDPAGGKVSKKRMTILLTVAMDGHMEPVIVINNSHCPRSFKHIGNDPKRLPPYITWFSNRKAWMDSNIFKTFLITLDSKLQRHKAEGLILLDNFSAHKLAVECTDHLKNLRVEWLLPNCTSLVQPVDMGIGQAFKLRYRKLLHSYMANMLFND